MLKKNLVLAVNLRRNLHRHPELSGKEEWTKSHLLSFVRQHTSLEIHDRGRWFYAVYRGTGSQNTGRNIAFRADFDAIKMAEGLDIEHRSIFDGVAHKCGHDGHSAVLAAFALEVDQFGTEANIFFLFQFGEEDGSGAKECATFIDENAIDTIYAFHNMSGIERNSIYVIDGTAHYASTGMIIELAGSPCHASEPEKGINPAYGLSKIVLRLPQLSDHSNCTGQVLCTVIQIDLGEEAFGISASKGRLLLTIRTEREHDMKALQRYLEEYIATVAGEHQLDFAVRYVDTFPETYNHKESNEAIRKLRNKGFNIRELEKPFRASEDFGYYLKKTKGAIFYIGNGYDYPAIHTQDYDFNDQIIETGVEVFKALAL